MRFILALTLVVLVALTDCRPAESELDLVEPKSVQSDVDVKNEIYDESTTEENDATTEGKDATTGGNTDPENTDPGNSTPDTGTTDGGTGGENSTPGGAPSLQSSFSLLTAICTILYLRL